MFAKLKEKMTGGAQRISGRTDLLEAIAAACALVAAADGDVSDNEVAAMISGLKNHAVLGAAFSDREIEAVADKMLSRATTGRAGRASLMKEIEEARAKSESADLEMIVLIALDVADDDGIDDDEMAVIEKIGKALGINAKALADG